jgi:ribose-phosphate pyrophosphokinase
MSRAVGRKDKAAGVWIGDLTLDNPYRAGVLQPVQVERIRFRTAGMPAGCTPLTARRSSLPKVAWARDVRAHFGAADAPSASGPADYSDSSRDTPSAMLKPDPLENPGERYVRNIVVFSGRAHRKLAQDICASLGVELSSVDFTDFSNGCLQVQLGANCRQRDVYVIQPFVPPTQEHLMEMLMMLDVARGASAAQVTAVIPHYAYARSDKKEASRISIGGRLVADLLTTAGATRVLTMTLHAPQVAGFFSVPVDHLTALGILADHFRGHDLSDTVVVSPDLGNAKTAAQLGRLLGLPVAAGSKQRLSDDTVVIDAIVGDVRGKRAIVLDDEIATGGSILELLGKLEELGCREVVVATTHGLFTGKAVERLRGHAMITEVVTTDTVPAPANWPELKVRSVAPLFAEAIRRVHLGESVSSLFDGVDPRHGPPRVA